MRYSVTMGAVGAGRDPRGMAELARLAEEAGWDGFFLEDYLVYQGDSSEPTFDPWVCLSAMAMATSRITLGTTVTPLPRRHPWKVAAEAVALDHLSGGRFVLGAGLGDPGDPFLPHQPPRVLAEMLDESLTIINQLWTGTPVHFTGNHYQLHGAQLTARPLQHPRIPIWIGGNLLVPAVRARILRWDGSCAYKGTTTAPQQITPADIQALLSERPNLTIKVSGATPTTFAHSGATWWGQWIPPLPTQQTQAQLQAGPPR